MKKLLSIMLALALCLSAVLFTAACNKNGDEEGKKAAEEAIYSETYVEALADSLFEGNGLTVKGYEGKTFGYANISIDANGSFVSKSVSIDEDGNKSFTYYEGGTSYSLSVYKDGEKNAYLYNDTNTGMASFAQILSSKFSDVLSALPKEDVKLVWKAIIENATTVSVNGSNVTFSVDLDKMAAFANRMLKGTVKEDIDAVFGAGYFDKLVRFAEFVCTKKIPEVISGLKTTYGFDTDKIMAMVAEISGMTVEDINAQIAQYSDMTALDILNMSAGQAITFEQIKEAYVDTYANMKLYELIGEDEEFTVKKDDMLKAMDMKSLEFTATTDASGKFVSASVKAEIISRRNDGHYDPNKEEYVDNVIETIENIDLTIDKSAYSFKDYGYATFDAFKAEVTRLAAQEN